MAIPPPEQRKLALRSGNMCAFEDCRKLLTAEGPPENPVIVLGQMAHIVAESPDGPRGESPLTLAERNRYPNLIFLCSPHHQFIDAAANVPKFTVERLHAIKDAHEEWVQRLTGGRRNVQPELPPLVEETVFSNVLPVEQMPLMIYGAPCDHKESDIKPAGMANGAMTPFIVRGGMLWAFQDLRQPAGPFAAFVTPTDAERFYTSEWWPDPDKLGWFLTLLNRSLNKLTGRAGLMLDREHTRYYFAPEEPGREREVTYRPLNQSKATRHAVWQPKKLKTGEPHPYWYHQAVALRFLLVDDRQWCLSIRPELRVTKDGYASLESRRIGGRVTHKKSRSFNHNLLADVHFWRDYLSKSGPRIMLPFGTSKQRLIVSTSLASSPICWPGMPAEHAVAFTNVNYEDDLFSLAELSVDDGHDEDDLWGDDLEDEE